MTSSGLGAGEEVAVASWIGNTVTVAEDIESDATWNGDYQIQTPVGTETEWVDTNPPDGEVFYQVRRQ